MPVSKSKAKLIKRLASKRTPTAIAHELGLSLEEVNAVIPKDDRGEAVRAPVPWSFERIGALLLSVTILLSPLLVSRTLFDFSELPKAALIQASSLLLLTLWLIHFAHGSETGQKDFRFLLPFLIFVAWSGLSILWASDHYGAETRWSLWFAYALIGYTTFQTVSSSQRYDAILQWIFLSGVIVSIVGIGQYLFSFDWIPQRVPPAATFANKNMAGQFVALALPAGFILFVRAKRLTKATLIAAGVVPFGIFALYTVSRGVYLAILIEVIVGATCALIFAGRQLFHGGSSAKLLLVAATVMCVLVLAGYSPRGWSWIGNRIFDQVDRTQKAFSGGPSKSVGDVAVGTQDSTQERLVLYANSWELVKSHSLLGVGLANFQAAYPQAVKTGRQDLGLDLFRRPKHAHNDLIQITVELGLIGLALLAWLVITLLSTIWHAIRSHKGRDSQLRIYAISILIPICGYGMLSVVSFPAYRTMPPFLLTLYVSAFLGYRQSTSIVNESHRWIPRSAISKRRARAAYILTGMILVGFLIIQVPRFRADYYYQGQRSAVTQKRWESVVQFGAIASRNDPFRTDVHLSTGSALLELDRYDEAITSLGRHLKSFPHSISCRYYLARAYEALEDFTKAESLLLALRDVIPHEGWIHRILGRVYASLDRPDEALASLQRATEVGPNSWEFHFFLGEYTFTQGKFNQAVEAFRKVLELNETRSRAHFYLGYILVQKDSTKEEGKTHLRRVLELDPDGPYVMKVHRLLGE